MRKEGEVQGLEDKDISKTIVLVIRVETERKSCCPIAPLILELSKHRLRVQSQESYFNFLCLNLVSFKEGVEMRMMMTSYKDRCIPQHKL